MSYLDYILPHCNTINKRLKHLHAKHSISLIDSLSKLSFISISTNFWSDSKGTSCMVLTGHFMSGESDSNSTILRFSTFEKRHFSDIIGVEIENQLTELNIFDKVVSITCDGAPNLIKRFDFFSCPDITRIRCQARLLHLIVCNALNLWIQKTKIKHTTDEPNVIYSYERLSHSLKKVNIFDIGELSSNECSDESSDENNSEHTDSQAEEDGVSDVCPSQTN